MQSADDAALNVEIGIRLRHWRVLRRLSLDEASAQVRISHVHLHRHETSAQRVSASMIYRLARVYGCTVGDLLPGLTGERSPPFDRQDMRVAMAVEGIPDVEVRNLMRRLIDALATEKSSA